MIPSIRNNAVCDSPRVGDANEPSGFPYSHDLVQVEAHAPHGVVALPVAAPNDRLRIPEDRPRPGPGASGAPTDRAREPSVMPGGTAGLIFLSVRCLMSPDLDARPLRGADGPPCGAAASSCRR